MLFQRNRLDQLWLTTDTDPVADATTPQLESKYISFTYDAAGNLSRIQHLGNLSAGVWQTQMDSFFQYDKANRVTSITHEDVLTAGPLTSDVVHSYMYDNASRVATFDTSGPNTASRTYGYDDAGQLTNQTGGFDGASFEYDDNGNRVRHGSYNYTSPIHTIDLANRLTNDGNYSYSYDNEGNITRRTALADGEATLYTYDHRHRLTTVETAQLSPGLNFTGASFSAYETGQDGDGGVPSSLAIEDSGQTLHLAGNTWKQLSFSPSLGLPSTTYTVTADTVLSFDFYSPADSEGTAIGLDNDNTHTNPYRFLWLTGRDAPGSGIIQPGEYAGGWQHYEVRLADYASAYPIGATFDRFFFISDDDAGGGGQSYFRHVRLTEGPPPATITESVSYTYDAQGRRVKRILDANGSAAGQVSGESFVYDSNGSSGDELSMRFGNSGELAHRYLYGPATDQVLADETFTAGTGGQRVSDEVLWLLADQQGSVRDIVDDTVTLRKHVDYRPFGQVLNPQTYGDAVDQLFYYTGQQRDAETGLELHGARWYDPGTGRWLSEDPTGFDGGDPNLYRYVGNGVTYRTDPTGTTQAGNPLANLNLYAGGYSGNSVSANKPISQFVGSTSIFAAPTYNPHAAPLANLSSPIITQPAKPFSTPKVDPLVQQFNQYSLNKATQNFLDSLPYQSPTGTFTGPSVRVSTAPLPTDSQILANYFNNPEYGSISRRADEAAGQQLAQHLIQQGTPGQAFAGRLAVGLNGVAAGSYPIFSQLNDVFVATDSGASTSDRLYSAGSLALQAATFGLSKYLGRAGTATAQTEVVYTLEGRGVAKTTRQQLAFDYEDSLVGAASDVATRRRIVPALQYNNPNPRGSNLVRFDAQDPLNPNVLIDRKLNVTTHSGQIRQLERQAEALRQNPGYSLRIEVPTDAAARAARHALDRAIIPDNTPVQIHVVPHR